MLTVDLPDLSRIGRSLWDRYGTHEKLENARRLARQTVACAEHVDAWPWRVILEPVNACNLRCEECLTHRQDLPRGVLGPDDVDRYLADLWPYLVQVNLFNWGEPFLHSQLPELIAAVHRHGVGTHVHSNMNRLPAGFAERIVDAGLDYLVASIDGVTQEVYEQYRVGGSCDEAMENLATMVRVRNAKGSSTPRIIWRMLCFPHNLGQLEEAEYLAAWIGVDDFAVAPGTRNGQIWTPDGPQPPTASDTEATPPYCTDLYDFPAIHWDGSVLPCCNAWHTGFVWGSLTTSSWHEAFNSEGFRTARRIVGGDRSASGPCTDCTTIRQARRS